MTARLHVLTRLTEEERVGTQAQDGGETATADEWPLAARGAAGLVSPGGARALARAIEGADIDAGSRVVELGAGFGAASRRLLAAGPRTWTGVDDDPLAVEHLRRNHDGPGCEVVLAPPEATGLDDGMASAVVADGLLCTRGPRAVRAALAESRRLLGPSGRLAVIDIVLADGAPADVADDLAAVGIHVRSVEVLRGLVEDAGLVVVGSIVGPLDLEEPAEIARASGPRMAAKLARGVTRAEVRRAATAGRQTLQRHEPHLRSVVVAAERPLVLGLRRPR